MGYCFTKDGIVAYIAVCNFEQISELLCCNLSYLTSCATAGGRLLPLGAAWGCAFFKVVTRV